jgi:curved DNA-binding protein CbpA
MDDYYKILGITRDATQEELRQSYRSLVKTYHPDRFINSDDKASADERMKEINAAYSVLSNPDRRALYNASLPVDPLVRKRAEKNPEGSRTRPQEHPSGSQGTTRPRGERSPKNPGAPDPRVTYLNHVLARWEREIAAAEPFSQKANEIDALINRLAEFLAGYSGNLEQAVFFQKLFEQAVKNFVVSNFSIGAEEEYLGSFTQYPKAELQIVSIKPVLDVLKAVKSMTVQLGYLSMEQATQIEDRLFSDLVELQKSCQRSGADLVRNRYPKTDDRQTATSPAGNGSSSAHSQAADSMDYRFRICKGCGKLARTETVEFHRIIGLVLYHLVKKVEGDYCAECIEKAFWNFFAVDLFLGWWGIFSLFYTPVYLFINIQNYHKAWKLRKGSRQLAQIAMAPKLAVFFAVAAALCFAAFRFYSDLDQPQNSMASVRSTRVIAYPIAATLETKPLDLSSTPALPATATPFACKAWTAVDAKDAGLQECVYGVVQNTYTGGNVFYILFSKSNTSFRMISSSGNPYKELSGLCVMVNGVVQVYNGVPYIEVGDTLQSCP